MRRRTGEWQGEIPQRVDISKSDPLIVSAKKFDLKVGDKISFLNDSVEETKYYTVTKLYPYIFVGTDPEGNWATFSKSQYLCGEVRRVGHFGEDYQIRSKQGHQDEYAEVYAKLKKQKLNKKWRTMNDE